jgi:hypothetical protein
MQEMSYLKEPGFSVTSSRVDIAGQTFATHDIGSVQVEDPHRSVFGLLVGALGLVVLFFGAEVFGLCLAVVGSLWALITLNMRKLSLVADGGAVLTLESSDVAMVERVRSAIAKAMAGA